MLAAKAAMLDVVGIMQDHDAITGTAKQHTANDYNKRIYKGIERTNPVYAGIVDKIAQKNGLDSASWSWCHRQNGTYTECPVSEYAQSSDFSMVVANHNPSLLLLDSIQVLVPHGSWTVEKLENQEWVAAEASVICNEQQVEFKPTEV